MVFASAMKALGIPYCVVTLRSKMKGKPKHAIMQAGTFHKETFPYIEPRAFGALTRLLSLAFAIALKFCRWAFQKKLISGHPAARNTNQANQVERMPMTTVCASET